MKKKGITLITLSIVVVVMAILAATTIQISFNVTNETQKTKARK